MNIMISGRGGGRVGWKQLGKVSVQESQAKQEAGYERGRRGVNKQKQSTYISCHGNVISI